MNAEREICFAIADILKAFEALGDDNVQKSYNEHGGVYEAIEKFHKIANDLQELKEKYS